MSDIVGRSFHHIAGTTELARNLGFLEAPVRIGDHHVWVTSMTRGVVYQVPLDGSASSIVCECGSGPNGLAIDPRGELLVAQSGGTVMSSRSDVEAVPSIQRWHAGELTVIVDEGVTSPSDCVIGPDNALWFTDPADHDLENAAPGCLRRLDLATGELSTKLDSLSFPNGLAFGTDPQTLYVAETSSGCVRRYSVTTTGVQPDGWSVRIPRGKPDGIALDEAGWLWVAGSTGANVMAFDPDGNLRDEIFFGRGGFITSLCFAGPDRRTLVVTSPKGGRVIAVPAIHPGLPLPAWRTSSASSVAK